MNTNTLNPGDRVLLRSYTAVASVESKKREVIFLRPDRNDPQRVVVEVLKPGPREPKRKSVRKMFLEPLPAQAS